MTQYFYVGRKNLNVCGIAISRLRSFAGGLKLLLVCGCLLVVCGHLLVVCDNFLVVCGCLLVVFGSLLLSCGHLLVVCGCLWLLVVICYVVVACFSNFDNIAIILNYSQIKAKNMLCSLVTLLLIKYYLHKKHV